MAYNFLKDAKEIRSSTLCLYDTLDGHTADFSNNGDVDGWDIYNNICMYGCWNNVLFGTAMSHICYIQRTNYFLSLEAEEYSIIEIIMKLTPEDGRASIPTEGKIMWLRTDDNSWTEDKSVNFDLKLESNWQRYIINMGPSKWWQGNVNNLRIYPFIDGHSKCKIGIKSVVVKSLNKYTCKQTSCDYFLNYEHPCPGMGDPYICRSSENKSIYTTVSGVSDSLIVNIDDYGDYLVEFGTNTNVDIINMCRIIEKELNALSIGGYKFSEVQPTIDNKIEIQSGTVGKTTLVKVVGGTAASELTFFDIDGKPIYEKIKGTDPASHFDYASSVRLSYSDISKLLSDENSVAYTHRPNEFSVEIGNRDFYYIITSNATSKFSVASYVINVETNIGSTIIDVSHPATNNGLITDFYINCGRIQDDARLYVMRPHINGDYSVVDYIDLPKETEGELYTVQQTTHHIQKNILVSRGDVLAVYNAAVAVAVSEKTGNYEACYFSTPGKPTSRFTPEKPMAEGVIGFHMYAKSRRMQDSFIIDVDFGYRLNANKLKVKGVEHDSTFEYNLAICEDINWNVDCVGETHTHWLERCIGGTTSVAHDNIPYGVECLSDGIRSPYGGKQGDNFFQDTTGIVTEGTHSYFYVNGDGEWSFGRLGDTELSSPIYEFYLPPYCKHYIQHYKTDPIHFSIQFPHGYSDTIHKTVMYFKEGKNYRHFQHEYYVGNDTSQKTGKPIGHRLIPKYNSIVIDNIVYTEENSFDEGEVNRNVRDYLFVNPTGWPDPIKEGGVCINWEVVLTARDLTWNVLEHNFDKVECSGYRFITDYHLSTKMTEFEVYSSFPIEPSLIDNVSLSMSVDGGKWKSVEFDYTEDSTVIESTVNMSPRYLQINIFSQNEFKLYNMDLSVTNSVTIDSCDDTISLKYTDNPLISEVKKVTFENEFESIADFKVDLPKEYMQTQLKLVDVDFNVSNISKDNDNIVVYKNPDHYIELKHSQVANNCNAYALLNLIDNKKSYLLVNNLGIWEDFGILEHDKSLDYVVDTAGSDYLFIFDEISTRYLYIYSTDISYILNLAFYNESEPLVVANLYFNALLTENDPKTVSSVGILYPITESGYVDKNPIFVDDFNDSVINFEIWKLITYDVLFYNTLGIVDSKLYPVILVKDSDIGILTKFDPLTSFYFDTAFRLLCTNYYYLTLKYTFYSNDEVLLILKLSKQGTTSIFFEAFDVDDNLLTSVTLGGSEYDLQVKREYTSLNIKINIGESIYLNANVNDFSYKPATSLEVIFESYENSSIISQFIDFYVSSVNMYALNLLSPTDTIIVDFGKTININTLNILSKDTVSDVMLFKSRYTTSPCYSVPIVQESEELHNNYLSIDLGKKYILNFIRNYGPLSNKLNLVLGSENIEYSYSDTSTIEGVDWGINYNRSLIMFDGQDGSQTYLDIYNESRNFIHNGDYISTAKFKSNGSSCYFNGSSSLGISDTGYFNFEGKSFGIALYVFMASNIYEDVILFSKWANTQDLQAYFLGIDTSKNIFFTFKTADYVDHTLLSNTPIIVGEWSLIEISRDLLNLYLFINGTLVGSFFIGLTALNSTVLDPVISTLDMGGYGNFYGYIDNLHMRNGHFIHNKNYNVDNYIDSLFEATFDEYRWLKIKIPTGTSYSLDKLGLYPDISRPTLSNSDHYNCEWEPLGVSFTDYFDSACNITNKYYKIWASSFVEDCGAEKVISGSTESYSYSDSWGFKKADPEPTLNIVFDTYYSIDTIKLYHGAEDGTGYINHDFRINGYTTTSGDEYRELVNVTGNTLYDSVHTFDATVVQRLELIITDYTSGENEIVLDTASGTGTMLLDGGFLKEIEVFTSKDKKAIYSDTSPVVCFDLNYKFDISNYEFEVKEAAASRWLSYTDNIEDFTSYSDADVDNPKKIEFQKAQENEVYLRSLVEANSANTYSARYNIATNLFLDKGSYSVHWEAYNSLDDKSFCLNLVGSGENMDIYPDIIGQNTWKVQLNKIYIKKSGIYNLYFVIKNDDNSLSEKGAKNVTITKSSNQVRWISFTDNTAEDFSFDGVATTKGSHSFSTFRVYSADTHKITENSKWWASYMSVLSDNSIVSKIGRSALQIDYPTSSGIDYINYLEGDNFIEDSKWLEKDFLTFWWFIDDVDNFDTSYGNIGFGNINSNVPVKDNNKSSNIFIYGWPIYDLDLKSGWNFIKLQFSKWADILPLSEHDYDDNLQHPNTNARNKFIKSFLIHYRGTEKGPLLMYIDGLCISRCLQEEPVRKEKSLCLSYGEFAEVNLSNLTIEKGTVSFWAKLYSDSKGFNLFGDFNSRVLFSISSSDNDIILLGIRQSSWFEFGAGDSWIQYLVFSMEDGELAPPDSYIKYDEPFHVTVMWSNDGEAMSNGDTLRLYMNGLLFWTSKETWDIQSYNVPKLVLGGGSPTSALKNLADGSAIFESLKVYNYCLEKSDYNNSENLKEKTSPNDFVYISNDNENFYGASAFELPLTTSGVLPGQKVDVYIKTVKTPEFKNLDKKTADLLVDWIVTV